MLITLVIIKEIPYANVVISDKLWTAGIIAYIILAILFLPYNFLRFIKSTYIIYFFIVTNGLLLTFTLMGVPFLPEIFGTIVYGLFWLLVIYKIKILLKSSSDNS